MAQPLEVEAQETLISSEEEVVQSEPFRLTASRLTAASIGILALVGVAVVGYRHQETAPAVKAPVWKSAVQLSEGPEYDDFEWGSCCHEDEDDKTIHARGHATVYHDKETLDECKAACDKDSTFGGCKAVEWRVHPLPKRCELHHTNPTSKACVDGVDPKHYRCSIKKQPMAAAAQKAEEEGQECFQCGELEAQWDGSQGSAKPGEPCNEDQMYFNDSYPPVTRCPKERPYCMTTAHKLPGVDQVNIFKTCQSYSVCDAFWWQMSSDRPTCYTPGQIDWVHSMMCHVCCVGDQCNTDVVPPENTIWRP
eukprot:TRINITY_DN18320_c0_g1_i1.p1 TRINITY_DN18320_c0_g1~~TRINITY_DN18320_c0_g1_i1.p1  ORF type:complete len:308 (-),score=51.86 TRINITY_DN18320_c0_g1_i1:55-978(-)